MRQPSISGLPIFRYYSLNALSASTLRTLLAQLVETYIEQGNCTCLVSIDKNLFENLCQAYNDLLTGYHHPRRDSLSWRYCIGDATRRKILSIFPQLADDDSKTPCNLYAEGVKIPCHPSSGKKPK